MSRIALSATAAPSILALSIVMTTTACDFGSSLGDLDYAEVMVNCSMKTEPIALDELDSMGVSASEVLANAAPPSVGWIETADGEPEAVEIRFTANTDGLRKQVRSANGYEPCSPDALFVDGTLRIVSEHDLLDESLAVTLEARRDQDADMKYFLGLRHDIATSELGGSLAPTDLIEEPGFAVTGLELSGSFNDGAFAGLLSAWGEKHTRQHSDRALFDILTISTEPVE